MGPLLILILVRLKLIHFDYDMREKRFSFFVPSQWPWPPNWFP